MTSRRDTEKNHAAVDKAARKSKNAADLAAADLEALWTFFEGLTDVQKYIWLHDGAPNYAVQKHIWNRFAASFPRGRFDNMNQWINTTSLSV